MDLGDVYLVKLYAVQPYTDKTFCSFGQGIGGLGRPSFSRALRRSDQVRFIRFWWFAGALAVLVTGLHECGWE